MNAGATFIRLLHYAFIMFYVIAPFTQNSSLLLLHLMTGPLLWVHWYTLSDECSLTLIECWFRGIPYSQRQESFFFNVVSPIYKFKSDAEVRKFIWIASIILWLITLAKVLHNPSIVTEPFRQAWYGTNPPQVTRMDDTIVNSKPVVVGSHPREVFSYTLPQQRASSIIA
jgi:hypothetical protein